MSRRFWEITFILAAVYGGLGCTIQVKHRWENGFICKCRGGLGGAECDCKPTPRGQCTQTPPVVAQKGKP